MQAPCRASEAAKCAPARRPTPTRSGHGALDDRRDTRRRWTAPRTWFANSQLIAGRPVTSFGSSDKWATETM